MRSFVAIIFLLASFLARAQSFSAIPINDLGTAVYKGFQGGLYEGGSNAVPIDHDTLGKMHAGQIQPLDTNGNFSPSGAIVFTSIGMSNTAAEFGMFQAMAATNPAINRTTLKILNGAAGGMTACMWYPAYGPNMCNRATGNQYDRVRDQVLKRKGLTEKQVQVVWIKQANASPGRSGFTALCDLSVAGCTNSTAKTEALRFEMDLANTLRAAKTRWPNLKLAFISSRIYAGYATTVLNPEPYPYEYGLAMKWLIQAQINQERGLAVDTIAGDLSSTVAPWIVWGPYLWANGQNPRSDGLIWCNKQPTPPCNGRADYQPDGTHPSGIGAVKVVNALTQFFLNSPYSKQWFTR